jgi:ankyrin repeat protein
MESVQKAGRSPVREPTAARPDDPYAKPLFTAASGDVTHLKELLEQGADPMDPSGWVNGSTPLHEAAAYGMMENVEALLKAHNDPHVKNKRGSTARDNALQLKKGDWQKVADLLGSAMSIESRTFADSPHAAWNQKKCCTIM